MDSSANQIWQHTAKKLFHFAPEQEKNNAASWPKPNNLHPAKISRPRLRLERHHPRKPLSTPRSKNNHLQSRPLLVSACNPCPRNPTHSRNATAWHQTLLHLLWQYTFG